jgi:hypothetical protein
MMRLLTFGAGLAVGYVLGTRAGRDKYEQIVDKTRHLRAHPVVEGTQQKVSSTIAPAGSATPPVGASAAALDEGMPSSTRRPSHRGGTAAAPAASTDPSA